MVAPIKLSILADSPQSDVSARFPTDGCIAGMVVLASSDVVGGLGDVGLLIHDHEVSPPEDLQVQEEPLGGGTAVLQGHAIEAGLQRKWMASSVRKH